MEFRYSSQDAIVFETETLPICNFCGYTLTLTEHNKRNGGGIFYRIIDCIVPTCESTTRKLKPKERYKAFLPVDISTSLIEDLEKRVRQANRMCVEYWLAKGFPLAVAKEKISVIQIGYSKLVKSENRVKINLNFYLNKGYTEEEARVKMLTPSSVEFWIRKGFNTEEVKKLVSKNQSNASKHVDCSKRLLPSNVEYWLRQDYSHEQATEMVSKRQRTFSLNICIEKHGDEKGQVIFQERQDKWQKSLAKNGNMKSGFSRISQELFVKIAKHYKNDDALYYATSSNKEKAITYNKKVYLFDFVDLEQKIIIEYNGDKYHANPAIYSSNSQPHPYESFTASQIWENDKIKQIAAEYWGYKYFVVWDSDYVKNKTGILTHCLQLLNKTAS